MKPAKGQVIKIGDILTAGTYQYGSWVPSNRKYRVTKIVPSADQNRHRCWATLIESDGRERGEREFGWLDESDRPIEGCWSDDWVIEDSYHSIQEITSVSNSSSDLDFFRSVPEGYCPCNIAKSQCHYHR